MDDQMPPTTGVIPDPSAIPRASGIQHIKPIQPSFDASLPEVKLGRPMPDQETRKEFAELAATQARKVNLPKQPKIFFFIGRGRTGKTTNIRYLIGAVDRPGAAVSVLDADTVNPVLHQYVEQTGIPPSYNEKAMVDWITESAFAAIGSKAHLLVDLGGGDSNLGCLIQRTPSFVRDIEEIGGAVVACCTLGSSADDLMPLVNLHNLGFRPTATVLLFNEASLGATGIYRDAFASIQSHSFYRQMIDIHHAVPLLIPQLDVAEAVERRRLNFESAKLQMSAPGAQPLNFSQAFVLRNWLKKMDAVYQPISGWFA